MSITTFTPPGRHINVEQTLTGMHPLHGSVLGSSHVVSGLLLYSLVSELSTQMAHKMLTGCVRMHEGLAGIPTQGSMQRQNGGWSFDMLLGPGSQATGSNPQLLPLGSTTSASH